MQLELTLIEMSKNELEDLIQIYSRILEMSESSLVTALRIAKEATELFVTSGKKSAGVAASIVYIAGILENDRRTQSSIAKIAKVPESTIRNRYVDIVKKLKITRE